MVLRPTTNRPLIFDRSVMMSSVMPSEKYSCSGSPLMLLNGRTAIDGLSGHRRLGVGGGVAARWPRAERRHCKTRTGPVDVLQVLVAHVLEDEVELVADMVAHRAGHGDAAGPGDAFEPRGDIDPVAKDVVVLDDHVAKVDADAELDPAVLRHVGVAGSHLALDVEPRTRPRSRRWGIRPACRRRSA